ncbi:MAG: hypothetical protein AAF999_06550 [Pseudomonadota bacterium]
MKKLIQSVLVAMVCAKVATAQEAELRLAVPQALEDAGFMQFLVPRFSLKTSIRITRVPEGDAAQMHFGASGTPVFEGLGQVWHLAHDGDPRAERFEDWLLSDIGLRTIESYAMADGSGFTGPSVEAETPEVMVFAGDAALGETLSLEKCGRCHVVNESNRMKGMGSTPSFALMRTFEDWETRFATFHELKPHPSFTQIDGITRAFDPARPPPIVPVTMTIGDLDAILAYVAGIAPADLGAPLQFQ